MGGCCRNVKNVELDNANILSDNVNNLSDKPVGDIEITVDEDIPKMIIIDENTRHDVYNAMTRHHWFDHYKPGTYIPIRALTIDLHLFISKHIHNTGTMVKIRDFVINLFIGLRMKHLYLFDNFQIYAITNNDPDVLGAVSQGHKNTGGKGFLVFNIDMVCQKTRDTISPGHTPTYRMWDTPIHEFGHAVESTIGFKASRISYYKKNIEKYNDERSDEYFAWSTERWFGNHLGYEFERSRMVEWEFNFLSRYYDEGYKWKPTYTSLIH